ncbi:hypothetical protein [Tenacibaculum sp. 47A_GOM-205m]|uniref:hypothetical protein n=1 Tax=Tenacibaculum sp. 47A_GOM-205m TaxID=1380384 RepID=UPI00048C0375|nr:hypothetical protein [Tenacibaculum sp. 47A_GOM-205m]
MSKVMPYFYFVFGLVILFDGIVQFLENKELYKLLFSWNTTDKYFYLSIKIIFSLFFFLIGYKRLKVKS